MRTASERGNLEEAIAVMQASEYKVSTGMRSVFAELTVHLEDAWRASNDWRMGAPMHDEPMRVKKARDEVRFMLEIERVILGTDGEHQFFRRALSAVLALTTIRLSLLVRAGRTGDGESVPTEHLEMERGFLAARQGLMPQPVGVGAAIQEASRIGQAGGAWVRFVIDGFGA